MKNAHLHKIMILSEEMEFMEQNRLVSNSFMEGMIFREMIEHPFVMKAKELGEIEIRDEMLDGFAKTITIYAYFNDDALDMWYKFLFLERLKNDSDS